jgi:AcrR family transcriptional regulator
MSEPKRPYHHGKLKEALLERAAIVLKEAGADELSLRDLAKAVGVSPNAPYRHFEDKAHLLAILAAQGYDDLSKQLSEHSKEGPAKRLREAADRYFLFAEENARLYQLMFTCRAGIEELDAARDRFLLELKEMVRLFVGEATVNDEVEEATIATWSLWHGGVTLQSTVSGSDLTRMLGKGIRG